MKRSVYLLALCLGACCIFMIGCANLSEPPLAPAVTPTITWTWAATQEPDIITVTPVPIPSPFSRPADSPFPFTVEDIDANMLSSVRIELSEREYCLARCAQFELSVSAEGVVEYEGFDLVLAEGKHTSKVDASVVASLFTHAVEIGFFDMARSYPDTQTDVQHISYCIRVKVNRKCVRTGSTAPESIWLYRDEIVNQLGADQWIGDLDGR